MRKARKILDQPVSDCRVVMVFDGRWKYIHFEGFRAMLFDTDTDTVIRMSFVTWEIYRVTPSTPCIIPGWKPR